MERLVGFVFFADPALHTDLAPDGLGFGEAVIDILAQRVQRNAALALPFAAGDVGTAEAARALDLDAVDAEGHRDLDGLLDGAAERDAALELERDVLGHELGLDLGLLHFLDVQQDLLADELAEILLTREPARLPVAADGEAEACRVGLLSHGSRLVGFAVGEDDAEVRHALDARLGRALGAGLEALQHRTGFHEGAVHGERAGREAVVVLRVRHGALERLDEEAGRLARDEREEVDGLGHGTALDLVRDFADLARGHTRVAGESLNFHCSIPIRRTPQISLRVMPPCALKIRVGANSPSLWPTMFSVAYTALCALPL